MTSVVEFVAEKKYKIVEKNSKNPKFVILGAMNAVQYHTKIFW